MNHFEFEGRLIIRDVLTSTSHLHATSRTFAHKLGNEAAR